MGRCECYNRADASIRKLQAQLDNPPVSECTIDLAEGGIATLVIRQSEIRPVEEVKKLGAKLNGLLLAPLPILEQRHIKVGKSWTPADSAPGVPQHSISWKDESIGVKPSLD